jgi:GT2 family glycosyltransferase
MLLSIIVPVFNHWNLTRQCLESLQKTTPGDDFEVIVVDNGSTDESPREVPQLGHSLFGNSFKHLRSETNLNFGPGCNLGARNSTGKLIFFLNNDTILTPNWLPPLVKEQEQNPRLGAVGPLLLYPEIDRVQHLGVTFTPTMKFTHLYHYFPKDHPVVKKRRDLQAITGAALLTPSSVFQRIGGFHEKYRNGFEDLDYCARLKELGLKTSCVPESIVYHLTSQTLGRFDAENANACLFSSRCQEVFISDLHAVSADDEYVVKLTGWLQPYVVLENQIASSRGLNNKSSDLEELWNMVLSEPAWECGYRRLLHLLTMKKMWNDARCLLKLELNFIPKIEVIKGMIVVADRRGDVEEKIIYMRQADAMEKISKSSAIRDRYILSVEYAKKHKDNNLLKIIESIGTNSL